jgi:hypothetical protein
MSKYSNILFFFHQYGVYFIHLIFSNLCVVKTCNLCNCLGYFFQFFAPGKGAVNEGEDCGCFLFSIAQKEPTWKNSNWCDPSALTKDESKNFWLCSPCKKKNEDNVPIFSKKAFEDLAIEHEVKEKLGKVLPKNNWKMYKTYSKF